eukprot:40166_1
MANTNATNSQKLFAPSYGLRAVLEHEEESKFQLGDHIAVKMTSRKWNHGWRVSSLLEDGLVIKKSKERRKILTSEIPILLKTDSAGAMAIYRNLKQSERSDLREVFALFDQDGDGQITPADIMRVTRNLSPPGSEPFRTEAVVTMVAMFDATGTGFLDFEDFIKMMTGRLVDVSERDEFVAAFEVFDENCDEKVSAEELMDIMKSVGQEITLEEINAVLEDIAPDGLVDFQAFRSLFLDVPVVPSRDGLK